MSREQMKGGKQEQGSDEGEKVVVAVKASKEIPKNALVWALTHVVQPGNCITLLVVVSSHNCGRKFWETGRKLWGFPKFSGDCSSGHRRLQCGARADQRSEITDYCSQMFLQLHDVCDPKKINVKIKIISGSPCGAVAAEVKRNQASWVVLDKELKHEERRCMEELQCNIVVMKRSQAKVLRLNLVESPAKEPELIASANDQSCKKQENKADDSARGPLVTPLSSPETFTATEAGTSSVSSSDPRTSPFYLMDKRNAVMKEKILEMKQDQYLHECSSDSDNESLSSSSLRFQPWMPQIVACQSLDHVGETSGLSSARKKHSATKVMLEKLTRFEDGGGYGSPSYKSSLDFKGNLRDVISLSRTAPPGSPPLCSICQHKAPEFGKPPRWFTYAELELATGRFSQANFLAEGGFGSVHRGLLPDGQAIAVKQHKLASSQGDQEFCSEVEVLSCAQHRNVVMLIGFCIEDGRRLLVYEYICNRSLDAHLYGRYHDTLSWYARHRIAVGAARGLRYLHEECRVGCIVHRDMRPNNILITHDFEPMVGDFGLARWQPDGETGVETRVIGTFGYLAPEYAQSGQITEKADVYSFGVVLVELVTGHKALDLSRPKGQQFLTEWARPLLQAYAIDELVDPRLSNYTEHQVYCMLHAASLCLRRDPHSRPRMSQVLRILDGDVIESGQVSTSGIEVGSQSGRIGSELLSKHGRSGSGQVSTSGIQVDHVTFEDPTQSYRSGQVSTSGIDARIGSDLQSKRGPPIRGHSGSGQVSTSGIEVGSQSARIGSDLLSKHGRSGSVSERFSSNLSLTSRSNLRERDSSRIK